jgi:hypothetical protein
LIDVSAFEQVQSAIDKAITTFGTLDVALNYAGIGGEANKVGPLFFLLPTIVHL